MSARSAGGLMPAAESMPADFFSYASIKTAGFSRQLFWFRHSRGDNP